MTRDELIQAIYDSDEAWSCPDHPCDLPEEEGNTGKSCMKCAGKQLAEYEAKVRADERANTIDEFIKTCDEHAKYDMKKHPQNAYCLNRLTLLKIAEQLKGAEEMSYRDSSTVYGFPDRLRDAIYIKNNLNASQVADALAVDRKTVAGYLEGERTPNLVIFARMCSFLKVSPNWLITGKE